MQMMTCIFCIYFARQVKLTQLYRKQPSRFRSWPNWSTNIHQALHPSALQHSLHPSQVSVHVQMRCALKIMKCLILKLFAASQPSRYSWFSAGSVRVPGSSSVHHTAEPKHVRGWAQSRDEHSGKETHQDLAQRHPGCYQPRWCVTELFISFLCSWGLKMMFPV